MSGSAIFDERVAVNYEAWYETPDGRRADALERASLRRLLKGFSCARSVLEVGCGTGHFARWLGEEGSVAVGLDLSTAMLAEARRLNGVPLVQGDAYRLPFADGSFDLVALITTLEFLRHPGKALMEAFRLARWGLLLGVLNRWSLLALRRRLAGLFRPTLYDAARFYGVGELRRLLRSIAGGRARIVWHTTLFPRWWPWPQADLPWGGFIAMALSEERRDRAAEAVSRNGIVSV